MLDEEFDVDIERVAHGGHCVGRIDGRVVFVRHTLPGERVRVRITGIEKSFLRGDAIAVLRASPDRVEAPCPLAHADGCGGCDFQHASLPAQRALKTSVVREQLQRLAGIESDVEVEAVEPTLHWRTRMQFVPIPGGYRGLRKHRSHDVIEVGDCLIEAPGARDGDARGVVSEEVLGKHFDVEADGFWQVHPEAPRVLVETVLEMLEPQAGETAIDLYAGVGLFSSFLADAVGSTGSVISVEGNRRASRLASENLSPYSHTEAVNAPVENWQMPAADVVVLDPPRTGAKKKVVEAIAAAEPHAVAYVACDPSALARDIAYFAAAGYRLQAIRAFDLFPMTHHVECVALLTR